MRNGRWTSTSPTSPPPMPASTSPARTRATVIEKLDSDIDFSAAAFPYMAARVGHARRHSGAHPARRLRRRAGLRDPLPVRPRRSAVGPADGGRQAVRHRAVRRRGAAHPASGEGPHHRRPGHRRPDASRRSQHGMGARPRRSRSTSASAPSTCRWPRAPTRKLAGFALIDAGAPMPKECHLVIRDGDIAGRVTSVTRSPTLDKVVGLAYLPIDLTEPGKRFEIRVDGGVMVRGRDGGDAVLRSRKQAAGNVTRNASMIDPVAFARRSPLRRQLQAAGAVWGDVGDAAIAESVGEAPPFRGLGIVDLSPLPRLGFKGRGTIPAMQARGITARSNAQSRLSPAGRRPVPRAGAGRSNPAVQSRRRRREACTTRSELAHRGRGAHLSTAAPRQPRLARRGRRGRTGDVRQAVRHRSAAR